MLHLTFLGTSAGVPTKSRNVTGLAIECINPFGSAGHQPSRKNKPWILIDCGEATQHQLLKTNISSHQLAVICITHVHGDHCYGLPGMLASMAMSGRKQPLTLIAPQAIESFLKVLKQTTQLYLPFEINFVAIEQLLASKPSSSAEADSSLETGNRPATVSLDLSATHQLDIEVIKLSHRVDAYGFRLTQTLQTIKLDIDKLKEQGVEPTETWGKLQAGQDVTLEEGRQLKSLDYTHRQVQKLSVVVAGDNDTPQLLSEAVQGASVLIHEATYTQAVLDKIMARPDAFDPMHTPAQRIANFAQSVNLSNLILTHFSARYQPYDDPESKTPNMADIRLEVERYYQGKLWLARDFMRFEVSDKGVRQLPS